MLFIFLSPTLYLKIGFLPFILFTKSFAIILFSKVFSEFSSYIFNIYNICDIFIFFIEKNNLYLLKGLYLLHF